MEVAMYNNEYNWEIKTQKRSAVLAFSLHARCCAVVGFSEADFVADVGRHRKLLQTPSPLALQEMGGKLTTAL
jgi:hypothetical protein